MKVLLITLVIVFFVWVLTLFVQRAERKSREEQIKKRLEERKKEEEEKDRPPYKSSKN